MSAPGRPACRDEQRRALVLDHPKLNGIDWVDFGRDPSAAPEKRFFLDVTFLKTPLPDPTKLRPKIEGGVRVTGIDVLSIDAGPSPLTLRLYLNEEGDFSPYTLILDAANTPDLDPELARAPIDFKAGCPSELDCKREPDCPPEVVQEPALDYLAKDFASFRRLLLDLAHARNPAWRERHPAELGVVLAELLAYEADRLSYFQDAVGTEAYLETCRSRVSVKRHARLIDWRMHDGRNAWTYAQLDVSAPGIVPAGTQLLTRITRPLRGLTSLPPVHIPAGTSLDLDGDPALRETVVFEATARARTDPSLNRMFVHVFGNAECCLPQGATSAFLYALAGDGAGGLVAVQPAVEIGDYVLFEEVRGPATGNPADADPLHRHVVRVTEVVTKSPEPGNPPLTDPTFRKEVLPLGEHHRLQTVTVDGQAELPLVQVWWDKRDALPFASCLSTRDEAGQPIEQVSLARGNVTLCDHGRTIDTDHDPRFPLGLPATQGRITSLTLPRPDLTFEAMPAERTFADDLRLAQGRHDLAVSPRDALPAAVVELTFENGETEVWEPQPDLLGSAAFDQHFTVEVDDAGRTSLRFGDDEYGRRPLDVVKARAVYRVGNGPVANLGRGALAHIVEPPAALLVDPTDPTKLDSFPTITSVYQPLAARGGTAPESIEEVRAFAPPAIKAFRHRAVTERDWEEVAKRLAWVQGAKAAFRWTGSWHTVFLALHPKDPGDLVREPGGRARLLPERLAEARAHLTRFKLAGYDLAVRTAQYVPLKLTARICVEPGHFRGPVLAAVRRALSNRRYADGSTGFFHTSRLDFDQDLYLSRIYAAIAAVPGVGSVVIEEFRRFWSLPNGELETGILPIGPFEVPRLDNDPSLPENGVLELKAVEGL